MFVTNARKPVPAPPLTQQHGLNDHHQNKVSDLRDLTLIGRNNARVGFFSARMQANYRHVVYEAMVCGQEWLPGGAVFSELALRPSRPAKPQFTSWHFCKASNMPLLPVSVTFFLNHQVALISLAATPLNFLHRKAAHEGLRPRIHRSQ